MLSEDCEFFVISVVKDFLKNFYNRSIIFKFGLYEGKISTRSRLFCFTNACIQIDNILHYQGICKSALMAVFALFHGGWLSFSQIATFWSGKSLMFLITVIEGVSIYISLYIFKPSPG